MKKLAFGFIFAAVLGVVLHAGHPDAAHLSASHHECGLCQVVTASDAPAVLVAAPHFQSTEVVLSDFVFVTSSRLSLLSDPRGPPAA